MEMYKTQTLPSKILSLQSKKDGRKSYHKEQQKVLIDVLDIYYESGEQKQLIKVMANFIQLLLSYFRIK